MIKSMQLWVRRRQAQHCLVRVKGERGTWKIQRMEGGKARVCQAEPMGWFKCIWCEKRAVEPAE